MGFASLAKCPVLKPNFEFESQLPDLRPLWHVTSSDVICEM